MIKLSIVIPAYNEEKRISATLDDYLSFFQHETEIIVVLNGCTDNSAVVIDKYKKKHSQLKVIEVKEAIGKGGSVKLGLLQAQGEIIGFVDADGSTSAAEFNKLVQAANECDVVIASRWLKQSVMKNRTFLRKIASKIFILMVRCIMPISFSDTQCGAKVFRQEKIAPILPKLKEAGMAFDVELLCLADKAGLKIKEMPTFWVDKPGSATLGNPARVFAKGLEMLKTLIKIKKRIYA